MRTDRETARAVCASLFPDLAQISRQFEAALSHVADVAARTGEDTDQILQETRALAAASTMTVEQAVWYVAAEKQHEYSERERERLSAGGSS